jgi:predicted alpha/beta hydrolase family esterase
MKLILENWRKFLKEEVAAFHGVDMKPQAMNRKGDLPACDEPPEFGTGDKAVKNKEHGYYDNQWDAGEKGCPQFTHERGIGSDHKDIHQAIEFLDNVRPDELIAYSRGGAVALAALPSAAHQPHVTFVAPAWKRGWVTGIENPFYSNGVIIHGTEDKFVPLSHSADLSLRTGMDLYVFDGLGHINILKQKLTPTSGRLLSDEEKEELLRNDT